MRLLGAALGGALDRYLSRACIRHKMQPSASWRNMADGACHYPSRKAAMGAAELRSIASGCMLTLGTRCGFAQFLPVLAWVERGQESIEDDNWDDDLLDDDEEEPQIAIVGAAYDGEVRRREPTRQNQLDEALRGRSMEMTLLRDAGGGLVRRLRLQFGYPERLR
eukprot:scaffold300_cov258-Pinguiococcus_pyrenoidosus.AAC.54